MSWPETFTRNHTSRGGCGGSALALSFRVPGVTVEAYEPSPPPGGRQHICAVIYWLRFQEPIWLISAGVFLKQQYGHCLLGPLSPTLGCAVRHLELPSHLPQGTPVDARGGDQFSVHQGGHPLGDHLGEGDLGMPALRGTSDIVGRANELGQVALGGVASPLTDLVGRRPHPAEDVRLVGVHLVELADPGRDQLSLQLLATCSEGGVRGCPGRPPTTAASPQDRLPR